MRYYLEVHDHMLLEVGGSLFCFRKLEVLQNTAEEISQETGNEVRL